MLSVVEKSALSEFFNRLLRLIWIAPLAHKDRQETERAGRRKTGERQRETRERQEKNERKKRWHASGYVADVENRWPMWLSASLNQTAVR